MKSLYLLAASALALTAAACGPKVPAARAALECPIKQGELTRTAASPDGKTCVYTSEGGTEVTLQLVALQGGVDATLSNIETNLMAAHAKAVEAAATAEAGKTTAEKARQAATGDKATATGAEQAAREAAADTKDVDVDVKVDVGQGGAIVTEDGGRTRVDLPGIHIVADDEKDSAKVQLGPVKIDAGDDTAQIRIRRDVRLRGEALNPEKRGVRATFIYTGDDVGDGYRYVGYEAGGPKRGPITVAVVKSRSEEHEDGDLYSAVKRLVRRNGGV